MTTIADPAAPARAAAPALPAPPAPSIEPYRDAAAVQAGVRARLNKPYRRWAAPVAVACVGALVLILNGWNITGYPGLSDDEGTYLAQAWAVRHSLGLAHYTYWYDHPPFGWIQLAGLSWSPPLLLPHAPAVAAGRLAMLPVFGLTLGLLYVLARRIGLTRWASALAMVLFGLSPLSVTLNRQIYLDSFAVAWILLALVLAMSPRRHLWHHVAAGSATAIAVLSKETILLALPAVVLALWRTTKGGPRAYSCAGYAAGLVLVGLFYPIYALLRGELFPGPGHVSLVGAWQFQLADRGGSGWILAPGSPSNELLHSWLYYDQVLPLAGVAATIVGLFARRLRVPALASGLLLLMALRPSGYLPAMYVIQLLPFFAVLVAGVAGGAVRRVVRLGPREDRTAVSAAELPCSRAAAVLVVAALVPQWSVGLRHALTADDNSPVRLGRRLAARARLG